MNQKLINTIILSQTTPKNDLDQSYFRNIKAYLHKRPSRTGMLPKLALSQYIFHLTTNICCNLRINFSEVSLKSADKLQTYEHYTNMPTDMANRQTDKGQTSKKHVTHPVHVANMSV